MSASTSIAPAGFARFGLHETLVRGIRSAGFDSPRPIQLETIPAGLDGRDLVAEVTCREAYTWNEGLWPGVKGQVPRSERPSPSYRLVAYDCGIKRNILRRLTEQGLDVTVVPATTSAAAVRSEWLHS